jgi:hypothetical protein
VLKSIRMGRDCLGDGMNIKKASEIMVSPVSNGNKGSELSME